MTPARRWLVAFAVLFVAYQAPEGLGARLLHNGLLANLMMVAFLPIAWAVARWLQRGMGAAYALEWRARHGAWLLAGFVLALAMKVIALRVGLAAGIYTPGAPSAPSAPVAVIGTLAWLALSTFVPSIAEDILTRGFWARIPGWRWSGPGLVAFTATLYVLNHIYRLGNGPAEWLMLLCYGLAYGAALWRTGSLWSAVGLHWGWNFAGAAWDLALPTEVARVALAKGLSGGAHLLMLAVVLILWPRQNGVRDTYGSGNGV